ncbi:MAG: DUF2950 family protein [Planctomycetes bacterium]|nr:DUF2950 family protein [Planctomycetota bacterium]
MDEMTKGKSRFQFSLFELLLTSISAFLGCFFFLHVLAPHFLGHEEYVIGLYFAFGFASFSAMFLNRLLLPGMALHLRRKLVTLFLSIFLSWLPIGGVGLYITLLRSRPPWGGGESAPIAACKTYAEAQDIYRRTDWDSDGVLEYSLTISGANSLYEKTAGTGNLTLVDAAFAAAEGAPEVAQPKAGYVFKVLTGQGPNAPGGRKSYVVNGNMTQGYALVACPASYDGAGRNTFLINNTGTVYQKDLGPDTAKIVNALTEYNPDTGWVVSE